MTQKYKFVYMKFDSFLMDRGGLTLGGSFDLLEFINCVLASCFVSLEAKLQAKVSGAKIKLGLKGKYRLSVSQKASTRFPGQSLLGGGMSNCFRERRMISRARAMRFCGIDSIRFMFC